MARWEQLAQTMTAEELFGRTPPAPPAAPREWPMRTIAVSVALFVLAAVAVKALWDGTLTLPMPRPRAAVAAPAATTTPAPTARPTATPTNPIAALNYSGPTPTPTATAVIRPTALPETMTLCCDGACRDYASRREVYALAERMGGWARTQQRCNIVGMWWAWQDQMDWYAAHP